MTFSEYIVVSSSFLTAVAGFSKPPKGATQWVSGEHIRRYSDACPEELGELSHTTRKPSGVFLGSYQEVGVCQSRDGKGWLCLALNSETPGSLAALIFFFKLFNFLLCVWVFNLHGVCACLVPEGARRGCSDLLGLE